MHNDEIFGFSLTDILWLSELKMNSYHRRIKPVCIVGKIELLRLNLLLVRVLYEGYV
jgi:hypothetical protein